jgi:Transglutaminase-like superfamily
MQSWQQLVHLPEEELARQDLVAVHLACAEGLPGSEKLDIPRCLRAVDSWAERVRRETNKLEYQFRAQPESYFHSKAYFRILVMATVLQQDCGVHYHANLIEMSDEEFFTRADHLFLHGIVMGKGGSCTSLPIAYVAVGRRLGYPLKLVRTARHFFARWDDGGSEYFNVECTSRGLVCHLDEYYMRWPVQQTPEQVAKYQRMRSLAPRQELSEAMMSRGMVWIENGAFRHACEAFAGAWELDPNNNAPAECLVDIMGRWDRHLRSQTMSGFPGMTIHFPPRHYRTIPQELEQSINYMTVKESLLSDPRMKADWWDVLPRDPNNRPDRIPAHISVYYPVDGVSPPEIIIHTTEPPMESGQSNSNRS